MTDFIPAFVAFAVAFTSSIVAPGHQPFVEQYNTSAAVGMLPFSLFVLGLVFGPVTSTLISDIFGRKMVYLSCFPQLAIPLLSAALINSQYAIIVSRFFAGVSAGPCLSVGYGVIADIWHPEEHSVPLIMYNCMLLLGSFVGIVAGGFITQHLSWNWTQWISFFLCAACFPALLFMGETSKKTIQRIKRKEPRRAPLDPEIMTTAFKRPLRMLFKEPIVALQGVYVSFVFAVLYSAFAAWPYVFSQSYVFDTGSQGLVFASMATGLVVAAFILVINHKLIYKPAVANYRETKLEETEKAMAARRIASSPTDRKNSIAWSIRRVTSVSARDSSAVTALPQTIEQERNLNIAVVTARYINEIPANEGKNIMPERILAMLNQNPAYGDLCDRIEALGLKLDRVQLARAVVDALHPSPSADSSPASSDLHLSPRRSIQSSSTHGTPMARSKSLHYAAAASFGATPPLPYPGFASRHSPPPPEWRLWLAPLASFLVVAALFAFGWTARKTDPLVQYFAAIVAMGVFACGAAIGTACATLYVYDVYGQQNGACALASELVMRYVLAAVFPMFVLQVYGALETAWATSLFGFLLAVLGLAPCVLLLAGRKLRKCSGLARKE